MDLNYIADLAKQGGRLASHKQWVLADALAKLTPTQISTVAVQSGRNESTLLQYARAAERWSPATERVEGVTFSAHRVALSWHDPRGLLMELKNKYGSPTVRQVRQAMGLEGHPALELLEKGISKLDRKVSAEALKGILKQVTQYVIELEGQDYGDLEIEEDEVATDEEIVEVNEIPVTTGSWKPPVSTSDIAGI